MIEKILFGMLIHDEKGYPNHDGIDINAGNSPFNAEKRIERKTSLFAAIDINIFINVRKMRKNYILATLMSYTIS